MKFIFSILVVFLFCNCIKAEEQNSNDLVLITYVYKKVTKANSIQLKKDDIISFEEYRNLIFVDTDAYIYVHSSKLGNLKLSNPDAIKQDKPSFYEKLKTLLGFDKRVVEKYSLSTSSCIYDSPNECFKTDSTTNNRLLILNSTSFKDYSRSNLGGNYFVKFEQNGKIFEKKLDFYKQTFTLVKDDLKLNDSIYVSDTTRVDIILKYDNQSNLEIVNSCFVKVVDKNFLIEIYKNLKSILIDVSISTLYDEFLDILYLYYGKPNNCEVEQIIKEYEIKNS